MRRTPAAVAAAAVAMTTLTTTLTTGLTTGLTAARAATGATSAPRAGAVHPASARHPGVIGHRVIGRTIQHRLIVAWHVGDPKARYTDVVFAAMHGDETAPRQILYTLRDGRPITGVNLWLVPTFNPDGVALGTRQNANGVDLNRNFPFRWVHTTGYYYSGPRPGSAPETQAVMRFLNRVKPHRIVSFHQPFHAIDVSSFKAPRWGRLLAHRLRIPLATVLCNGGACHGTMTAWFNAHHAGAALTVELGASPTRKYLTMFAPRALLRSLGGRRPSSA